LTLAVERLERRLRREHAARLQAEAIAEAETLSLYENARRLALLETIATESNAFGSMEGIFARAVQLICEFTGWPLGHVLFRDPDAAEPTLRSSGVWFGAEPATFEAFRRYSSAAAFAGGRGLPGRVMAQAAAQWVADVTTDANFPRGNAARLSGVKAGYALPILIGDEVAAVLEFYLDRDHTPDERLLHTLERIGAILGRVIERDRAARETAHNHAELERMVQEAQAASRAKTAFLAVTSHEIRTPLNAVLGLAEALRRTPLELDQQDLVAGILDSGAMLLRLLNAVLDIAKVETGAVALAKSDVDLAALAETVVRLWRTKAQHDGVALDLALDRLPRPCRIHSDAGKIEQTLVNLLSNALKFSPPGSRVRLAIGATAAAGAVRVEAEVSDQGPGVTEEDRARIFRAYEQTSEGRRAGGAGLGLAICAANVRALGGAIGVADAEGGGSRFFFSFEAEPAHRPPEAAPEGAQDVEQDGADFEARSAGLKILIAEDNPANQKVLAVLLQPLDLAPTFVANGAEALAAVQAGPFDLILMDANMPVMDGAAAVARIRALPGPVAETPIHMVTANVFEEDVDRYFAAGADGILAKPIVVAELYALLTRPASALRRGPGGQTAIRA
jgi:signal transduction histidine kinase